MKNTALVVSGLIFTLVAAIHVVRYMQGWDIVVAQQNIPLQVSIMGAGVSALLALWMFVAAARK